MIIGLSGKKGTGKDTVGNYLAGYYKFKRRAFADAVKSVTASMFGFTPEQMNNPELKEEIVPVWDMSPRTAMQRIGTSMRQNFGSDVWIRKLNIDKLAVQTHNYVITDVRHKNEYDAVKFYGGVLIRVNRNTNSTDIHESETSLDGEEIEWDYILNNNNNNNDNFGRLYMCIDEIMLQLGFIPDA